MKTYLTRALLILIVILIYFFMWRDVRGLVTQYVVVPQIEYSQTNCDQIIHYDIHKPTSLRIHLYDYEIEDYVTFSYTTPAGFYLLMGLVFIIFLNGYKIHYQLLIGFHFIFWFLSSISIYPGLCLNMIFLHFTNLGIKYFTPFATFIIIIMILSPHLQKGLRK